MAGLEPLAVAQVWLAAVWLVAGTAKLLDPSPSVRTFRLRVRATVGLSRATIASVAVLELVLGVMLSAGWMVVPAAGATVLLMIFLLPIAIAGAKERTSCGCFGRLETGTAPGLILFRNLGIAAVAMFLVGGASADLDGGVGPPDLISGSVGAALFGVSAVSYLHISRLLRQ